MDKKEYIKHEIKKILKYSKNIIEDLYLLFEKESAQDVRP